MLATFAIAATLLPVAATAASTAPNLDMPNWPAEEAANGAVFTPACRSLDCEDNRLHQRLRFGVRGGLGATLVEFNSHAMPGQPRRAQHGLGVRSHQLESALNAVGFEARHCLAPVVRMHTKLSSSFDVSGTLWVYLRCTLE
jgi:hypothetical protein